MKQFDILLNIGGDLEWICGIFVDDVNRAIAEAISLVGKARYVGHKGYSVVGGEWVEFCSKG